MQLVASAFPLLDTHSSSRQSSTWTSPGFVTSPGMVSIPLSAVRYGCTSWVCCLPTRVSRAALRAQERRLQRLTMLPITAGQEMTSVRSLYNTYDSLLSAQQRPNAFPSDLTALIHREAERIWYTRVPWSYVTNNANTTATNEQQTHDSASFNYTADSSSETQSNQQEWRRTRQGAFVSQNVLLKSHHASSGPSRPRAMRKLPAVQPMDLSHLVEAGGSGRKKATGCSDTSRAEDKPEQDHSPPSEGSSPPPPAAPPQSDSERELAALKTHFIRRISNVVSVWIRKKALEKRDQLEAERLRERLMRETNKDAQHIHPGEEDEEEGTISCGNSEDTHKGKGVRRGSSPCALASSSSSSSASSSASTSPPFPPPTLQPAPAPSSSTVARLEDAVGDIVSSNGDGHERDDEDPQALSEDDDESAADTLLFDPAMGMGVDDAAVDDLDDELNHELRGLQVDDEGYAYHAHTRSHSHSHSHSHRSRSRPHSQPHSAVNSKRGTPRMGATRELIVEDEEDTTSKGAEARVGLGLQNSQELLSPQHKDGGSYSESGIRRGGTLHNTPPPYAGYRHSASPSRAHSPHTPGSVSPNMVGSRSSPSSPRAHTPHSIRGSPRRPLSRSGPRYVRHGQPDDDDEDEDRSHATHASSSISTDSERSESPHTPSLSDLELLDFQRSLWKPCLVELASPFVLVSGKRRVEAGIFFGFDKLMSLIESYRKEYPLSHQLASFHSLLRRTLPDLRSYFDDEGLDVTPFVKGWLESLFSGQMKLTEGGCLRLWGE